MVAAGDLEGAQSQVIEAATDQGVGFTKSFLEKYFPTVEVSFETKEGQKPTTGILVVAPLSDQKDIENTIFTQVSAFYTDNRTTLKRRFRLSPFSFRQYTHARCECIL